MRRGELDGDSALVLVRCTLTERYDFLEVRCDFLDRDLRLYAPRTALLDRDLLLCVFRSTLLDRERWTWGIFFFVRMDRDLRLGDALLDRDRWTSETFVLVCPDRANRLTCLDRDLCLLSDVRSRLCRCADDSGNAICRFALICISIRFYSVEY